MWSARDTVETKASSPRGCRTPAPSTPPGGRPARSRPPKVSPATRARGTSAPPAAHETREDVSFSSPTMWKEHHLVPTPSSADNTHGVLFMTPFNHVFHGLRCPDRKVLFPATASEATDAAPPATPAPSRVRFHVLVMTGTPGKRVGP